MTDPIQRDTHESYGTIRFSRVQMHETPLFASSILHSAGVAMEVHTAVRDRHLSTDWIHSDKLLAPGDMSPNQFVDAVTRLNQGLGAPITLESVIGDAAHGRGTPPAPRTQAHFDREAKASIQELSDRIDELVEATKGSARRKAEALKQQLASNLPFIDTQLKRQMDRTVTEAKMEFEAHASTRSPRYDPSSVLPGSGIPGPLQSPRPCLDTLWGLQDNPRHGHYSG